LLLSQLLLLLYTKVFSELVKKGMNEEKTKRALKTLNHERLDRVPITEWFWDEFVQRWKTEI